MAVPAFGKGSRYVELIKYARHDVIDDIVDRLRMVVERGHGRKDGNPYADELEHVLQVHLRERRLAHDQDQSPALLDNDIGGPMHEMLAVSVGDAAQRPH